jgi:hypothetical protein
MNRLIDGIREVLRENIDDKTKTNAQRFFKKYDTGDGSLYQINLS